MSKTKINLQGRPLSPEVAREIAALIKENGNPPDESFFFDLAAARKAYLREKQESLKELAEKEMPLLRWQDFVRYASKGKK